MNIFAKYYHKATPSFYDNFVVFVWINFQFTLSSNILIVLSS